MFKGHKLRTQVLIKANLTKIHVIIRILEERDTKTTHTRKMAFKYHLPDSRKSREVMITLLYL